MVETIPSVRSVFIPRLYHAQRAGRTQIPVRPAETVYAHFEHVEGVPSRSETVPLIKLRVMDRLIDRLAAVGTARYASFAAQSAEPGALVSVFA